MTSQNFFIFKPPLSKILVAPLFVLHKLLKCNWQEWPKNPRAMYPAADACSCNSSVINIKWKAQLHNVLLH